MSDIFHSIIIPTRNRPDLLMGCLQALSLAQTPKMEWEVLVMDNSDERFRVENKPICDSFSNPRYRYVPMELAGLMYARHQGAELARGTILSYLDDDSYICETWLLGIQQSFSDPRIGLITGPNYPLFEQTPPQWISMLWKQNPHGRTLNYYSLLDFGDLPCEIKPQLIWGCNYSIRKDIFHQVKGSHPDIVPSPWMSYMGDGETALSIKAAALGYKSAYSPLCAIQHLVPSARMTKEYLVDRSFRFGLHGSFAAYRRENGLGSMQGVALDDRGKLSNLRNFFRTLFTRPGPHTSEIDLANCTREQFSQFLKYHFLTGLNYHRRALKNDPALPKYVLRPDFWGVNATLPVDRLPDEER
jgi:glycosyltransferase involved in cell wall biosynthesis